MSIAEQLDALSREMGAGLRHGMDRRGLTLAKITNVTDPDKCNRVKCLPIGADQTEETDWCYVMTPLGGQQRGIFWFPRVDDLAVLAYWDNDPHRPLVIGSLWTTESQAPCQIQDGKVQDYILRTPSAIQLSMHDEDKKHRVTLTLPSGTTLVLDDETQKAELKDQQGKNTLTLDFKAGTVTIQAEKKLQLLSGSAAITLEESGNITLQADNQISTQTANVKIKASAGLEAEGATAKIKSEGTIDLIASGPATLKGTVVNLN